MCPESSNKSAALKPGAGLSIDPGKAEIRFSCPGISLQGGGPAAAILTFKDEHEVVLRPTGKPTVAKTQAASPLGPLNITSLRWRVAPGIAMTWQIGACTLRRGFTLQAAIHNGTGEPFRLKEFRLLSADSTLVATEGDPAAWHLHGVAWEGGTLAESLPSRNERTRRMYEGFNMPLPDPMPQDEKSTDGRWRSFGDVATLYSDKNRHGIYAGAVGEEADVRFDWRVDDVSCRLDLVSAMSDVQVDPGETRLSETVLFLAEPYADAADAYFRWLAAALGSRTHRGPIVGWCSWYDKWSNVTAEHVINLARAVERLRDRLPMQVIQIDDGYQQQAGNWDCNDTFPDGWKPVVDAIRDAKAIPGIWFAPLVVNETVTFPNYTCAQSGRLVDIHADWFQRQADGKLFSNPCLWGPRCSWLDPTHPGAQSFIRRIMRRGVQEGFRYFKIDFNTVGGRMHNPKKTNLQAFRDLYRLYREEIGEEGYLLSCTGFTRATVGIADASRIGPDSGAVWNGLNPCCIRDCIPAVANSAFANRILYANDPDVSYTLARGLTRAELQVWHSFVGLLGGTAMVSDPFSDSAYQAEDVLRMFEILTPPVRERGLPLRPGVDLACSRFGLVADRSWGRFADVLVYNPSDNPADIMLDPGLEETLGSRWHAWSFWTGEYLGIIDGGHVFHGMESHDGRLLRLTPVLDDGDAPLLVGSDLHIGMGAAELRNVRATARHMEIELTSAGATNGALYVHSSRALRVEKWTGIAQVTISPAGNNVWKLTLTGRERAAIQSVCLQARKK